MSAVAPGAATSMPSEAMSVRLARRRSRIVGERIIEAVLFVAALVSVFTTVGIVYILVKESVVVFEEVPFWDFLTDTQWTPLFDDAHFGIMVLLSGTLTSSAVALSIAIPLGTIIAIYLSEFAPFAVREVAKPFLELLGGVPTIIYGYFALLFVTPLLQKIYPELPGFNLLAAGIVMGIMIIPYVSSISEDAMPAVPITAHIGQGALGALPHGSIGYQTIFAAGLTLMLFTLACNIGGHVLRKSFREAYWWKPPGTSARSARSSRSTS